MIFIFVFICFIGVHNFEEIECTLVYEGDLPRNGAFVVCVGLGIDNLIFYYMAPAIQQVLDFLEVFLNHTNFDNLFLLSI